MFKRDVQNLDTVLQQLMRRHGLETPLQQHRVVEAWETVMGSVVARYTAAKFIDNQTLIVRITNPALKADLQMMRSQLTRRLNEAVGAMVIADVRII